ncbi:hypothetical protein RIF29_47025 [Crotalaria pallida]|uniref:Uncharacterized protein n=1 Tax=Crotalaria pallida TaxID=3830 RepID=A0AAN9DTI0_CROPI
MGSGLPQGHKMNIKKQALTETGVLKSGELEEALAPVGSVGEERAGRLERSLTLYNDFPVDFARQTDIELTERNGTAESRIRSRSETARRSWMRCLQLIRRANYLIASTGYRKKTLLARGAILTWRNWSLIPLLPAAVHEGSEAPPAIPRGVAKRSSGELPLTSVFKRWNGIRGAFPLPSGEPPRAYLNECEREERRLLKDGTQTTENSTGRQLDVAKLPERSTPTRSAISLDGMDETSKSQTAEQK